MLLDCSRIFTSEYTSTDMPRSSKSTRERILAAAYGLLYQEGFSRVSLDAIAAASGLTKKTLYYHFDSKDALVAAVLESQRILALARIQGWAKNVSNDPFELVENLFGRLADWASEPKWRGSGFTRIVMELADLPGHPARAVAKQHKLSVEMWLADRLAEMRVAAPRDNARQIMLLIEGCLSLILIHRDTSYARSAADAAKQLIASSLKTPRTRKR
jgi:AcrR family transcriptional regulator